MESLPLYEICKIAPKKGNALKEYIFEHAKQDGLYHCAFCGTTSRHKGRFQIDHIVPMVKGGLTVEENLQLLCRTCNMRKGGQ